MEKSFKKNRYDIPIVMCCASCAFKEFVDGSYRRCKLDMKKTKPHFVCAAWEMAEHLDKAGSGGGCIKKAEYLRYVVSHQNKGSLDQLRRDFEKKFTSIYAVKP